MMATRKSWVKKLSSLEAIQKGLSFSHCERTRKIREQLQEDQNVQRRRASAKHER